MDETAPSPAAKKQQEREQRRMESIARREEERQIKKSSTKAMLSWLMPVIVFGVIFLMRVAEVRIGPPIGLILGLFNIFVLVLASVFAVMGYFRWIKFGKTSILIHSIIGTLVNLPLWIFVILVIINIYFR